MLTINFDELGAGHQCPRDQGQAVQVRWYAHEDGPVRRLQHPGQSPEWIPARYQVCWRCEGHGQHIAHGADSTQCEMCHGERVLLQPDEDAIAKDPALSTQYRKWQEQRQRESGL
jgi:hypothetical protein